MHDGRRILPTIKDGVIRAANCLLVFAKVFMVPVLVVQMLCKPAG